MAKKKAAKERRTKRKDPSPNAAAESPVLGNAVERLQQLAEDLAAASKEAEHIAEDVQTGLAADMVNHRVDDAAKKDDSSS
jgi:hypothetical protein